MQIAERYGWVSPKPEFSHTYLLPKIRKVLKQFGVKEMLDIGVGNGAALPYWISEGIKVCAIEPDREGFEYARRYKKVDVRLLAVGDEMPIEWKKRFDSIVCLEVIEHLYNPNLLLHTASETLKPDGILIISTPYHGYLKNVFIALFNFWDFHHHPMRVGGHIKFWSLKSISNLARAHGYKVISFKGAGRIPFLWKSMVITLQKSV